MNWGKRFKLPAGVCLKSWRRMLPSGVEYWVPVRVEEG